MASARNVWLPGAGVWASVAQSAVERGDGDEMEVQEAKRRRGDPACEGDGVGLGLRDEEQGVSSHDVVCPICLGGMEGEEEAVLQWCMHRFCTHCIEEWSKVRPVCPLCKAVYHGWYHGVRSLDDFQERVLPPVAESSARHSRGDAAASHSFRLWRNSRRWERGRGRRSLQAWGHGVAPHGSPQALGRSAPFPTQRSFGLLSHPQNAQTMRIFEEQVAERALQWRKSVYKRNLKARPFEIGKRSIVTKDAEARAKRRLEPWIHRELQAVLQDSDPGFLVRLVLGLWFRAEYETIGRYGRISGQGTRNVAAGSTEVEGVGEAEATKNLKLFLGDKTELFWHELRCFAESPFTIQAYDTVVVYTRQDRSRRRVNRTDGGSLHQDSSLDSRRRSESTSPRLTSRSPNNDELGNLESNHQILRAGRRSRDRDSVQTSQALLARDSRAEQRKKRSHKDVIPIAEDRWQLSYC